MIDLLSKRIAVKTKLAVLNAFQTPEEIRAFFQKLGIKGCLISGQSCIIARYLGNDVSVGISIVCIKGDTYNFDMSLALSKFRVRFGLGRYPELVS